MGVNSSSGGRAEGKTAKQAAEPVAAVTASKPDLELLNDKGTSDSFSTTISGRIRNNTAKTYSYVQVTYTLYNKAGDNVGTARTNANNLAPGEIWNFKAVGFTSDGDRFKHKYRYRSVAISRSLL